MLKAESAGGRALSTQTTLDNVLEVVKAPNEFSKDAILHTVAQLMACDDQVWVATIEGIGILTVVEGTGVRGQSCVQELFDHDATQNKTKGVA